MPRNDAVEAVTGEIFRDGWSRIRGSMQGLHTRKQRQLMRVARGHRPAVFKAIRGGGTQTKSQLANQLNYLTTKSSHIVDSSGFLDGKSKLGSSEIKDLTERFTKRWSEGFKPKLGHTTHMLMSFPIGTRGEDVRDIAADVAERFFQTDDGHFDYIIAVHEDRDHPHAHIVLNRKSQEGEFFYLSRDHRFNYDDFRLAMVEEAEKYGVRLEATRRVDRGVVHYPPRTSEVYAARGENRRPEPRERVGRDLTRTLAEIANTRIVFHSLAAEATAENREDIADALFHAGELLARGGALKFDGDVYMGLNDDFDDLRTRYSEQVTRIEGMIANKPEAERPALERGLIDIQARLQRMQPLGLRSVTLSERPSEGGIYSDTNINSELVGRVREDEVRAQVETALRGTGISSTTVVARMETGAQNAALERQWIADDLAKIAEKEELNLERREELETATERLNQVHVHLGAALERAEVLRRDGVIEEAREIRIHFDQDHFDDTARAVRQEMREGGASERELAMRAGEIETRVYERIEAEQQSYLESRPELLASPTAAYRMTEEGRGQIVDQVRADQIDREIAEAQRRVPDRPVAAAVAEDFKARYPDMPDHLARGLGDTHAQSRVLNAPELSADRIRNDEVRRVVEHERAGNLSSPFADEAERLAYRSEVERDLDEEQIVRLRDGDSNALRGTIEDRLDRLYVAKSYLQSNADTANTQATREVVQEIADIEHEAQRDRDADAEVEKGQTHG